MKKYLKLLLIILIQTALLTGCDIFEKQEELDFTDTEAPVPGGGGALTIDYNNSLLTISWKKAKDDVSSSSKLKYTVYSSYITKIKTVDICEASGDIIGSGTNISSLTVTGVSNGYFNVVVEDEEGNKACYIMQKYTPTDT